MLRPFGLLHSSHIHILRNILAQRDGNLYRIKKSKTIVIERSKEYIIANQLKIKPH